MKTLKAAKVGAHKAKIAQCVVQAAYCLSRMKHLGEGEKQYAVVPVTVQKYDLPNTGRED